MLNEKVLLVICDGMHHILEHLFIGEFLEHAPLFAGQDLLLMQAYEVDAKQGKVICVMCLSYQKDTQHVSWCDIVFDVLAADLNESWKHEVVAVNQHLREEVEAVLANVKMVRVQILDHAVEVNLRNSIDFNQAVLLTFSLELSVELVELVALA
jgi:hypothetical protein